jgi:3',5'-cyclic AMP phosphodiesterase CpdA
MIRRQLVTLGRRQFGRRQLSALSTASSSRPAPPTPSSNSNGGRHLSTTTDVAHHPPSSPTARVSKDGVVGEPIDFDVGSKIEGNESQVSKVILEIWTPQLASFLFIH